MSNARKDLTTPDFPPHFEGVEDPRQEAKVNWPPDEVLLPVLCAVISGADGWTSIALSGEKKLEFLRRRRFLPFRGGTPCHDQLGHDPLGILFSRLDIEAFQRCFMVWVASLHETLEGLEGVVKVSSPLTVKPFADPSPILRRSFAAPSTPGPAKPPSIGFRPYDFGLGV